MEDTDQTECRPEDLRQHIGSMKINNIYHIHQDRI